jgi:hypothetical protein
MHTPYTSVRRTGTGAWLFLGLAALLVACFAAGATIFAMTSDAFSAGSPSPSTGGAPGTAARAAKGASPAARTPARPTRAAPVPVPVRDGSFEFTVESARCGVAEVGDLIHDSAKGQFCLVTLAIRNLGAQPWSFSNMGQKAHTADHVEVSSDAKATLYANGMNQIWFHKIEPGDTLRGIVVYDIPADAKLIDIVLHDSVLSKGVRVTL